MINVFTKEFLWWLVDLGVTAVLLILEALLHLLWFVLPIARIQEFVGKSLNLFRVERDPSEDPLFDADTVQLITAHGYQAEEHYTMTKDGYVLCLHRVLPKASATPADKQQADTKAAPKGVVLLMHGFMMNSEAWVVRGAGRDLPLLLADEGYDVWLGNNRGNKYSHKHLRYAPNHDRFWDFCIDHLAYYDLPALVEYILLQTRVPKISYIGFSQGSAQAFAAFSTNHELSARVNVFIALSPAARVAALGNKVVSAVSTSRPQLVFLLFGKKSLLADSLFWRRVLARNAYASLLNRAMHFLFGWKLQNIDEKEKPMCFSHLYSFSSVKNVVHWFQIIHTRSFQMFDDKITTSNYDEAFKTYSLPAYRPSNIRIPVALFYGEQDNILDIPYLAMELPKAYVHRSHNYEHLDFLWARDVHRSVYPLVMHVLAKHNNSQPFSPRLADILADKSEPSLDLVRKKKTPLSLVQSDSSLSLPIGPRAPLATSPDGHSFLFGHIGNPSPAEPQNDTEPDMDSKAH